MIEKYMKAALAVVLLAVLVTACADDPTGRVVDDPFNGNNNDTVINDTDDVDDEPEPQSEFSRAVDTTESWIRDNAPTFVYDGQNLEFRSMQRLSCMGCWNATFAFTSTHAGYGDRSGEVVAQVLTQHTIEVALRNNRVVSAVTDDAYDEFNEELIREPEEPEEPEGPEDFTRTSAINAAEEWVRENAGTFVSRGDDLRMRSAYPAPCEDCWTIVYSFEVSRRGFGFEGRRVGDADYDDLEERRMVVRVEKNEVLQALTDGVYDEVEEEFIIRTDEVEDEDDAEDFALDWMMDHSPTFRYDAEDYELEDVDERDCSDLEDVEGNTLDQDDIDDLDNCWRVIFDFTSEYEGYGDRTGDNPDRDDTQHEMVIWIADGQVVSAITDDVYDEVHEEFL